MANSELNKIRKAIVAVLGNGNFTFSDVQETFDGWRVWISTGEPEGDLEEWKVYKTGHARYLR